jgi:hypothetical protein
MLGMAERPSVLPAVGVEYHLHQTPNYEGIMDLSITGEVTNVLEEESGTGRNGFWRKQAFILKTEGEYPKEICVVQWGDSIDRFGVQAGEIITAHIDIQSREFKGRWYTDVKAWKIERKDAGGTRDPSNGEPPLPEEPGGFDSDDDALPF